MALANKQYIPCRVPAAMTPAFQLFGRPEGPMLLPKALVAIFDDCKNVDFAVARLVNEGFTTAQVSIFGKGYGSLRQASGFKSATGKIRFWGLYDTFWNGLWLHFGGGVSLTLPQVGHIMSVGPLAAVIASTVDGAVLSGGLSPLGAALFSCGIVRQKVAKFEQAVQAGGFIVVVQGLSEPLSRAWSQLESLNPAQMEMHDGFSRNLAGKIPARRLGVESEPVGPTSLQL